jgi:hypothetical protein
MILQDFELIPDKLNHEGLGVGRFPTPTGKGRQLWRADASRDGKRAGVHAPDPGAAVPKIEKPTRDILAAT